jgi:hypothetical protein
MSSTDRITMLKTRTLLATPSDLPLVLNSGTYTNVKSYVLARQVYSSNSDNLLRLPQPGKTIINGIDCSPDPECIPPYAMCKNTDVNRGNRPTNPEEKYMFSNIPHGHSPVVVACDYYVPRYRRYFALRHQMLRLCNQKETTEIESPL